MNETGIIGRFLPDWARIVGQMQFDTYHIFTVDEHTIEAVRILNSAGARQADRRGAGRNRADGGPAVAACAVHGHAAARHRQGPRRRPLDPGRGNRHQVGPQFGLIAEETETVSWLVLHHLLLSQTAFKRDIDDPKTIFDIAETIQSPERLKLLLVLTVADMRAVSPKVWNGWKATLLRELYARVAEVLAGGLSTTERDVRVRARARGGGRNPGRVRLERQGSRILLRPWLSGLLALASTPRRMCGTRAWCAMPKRAARR